MPAWLDIRCESLVKEWIRSRSRSAVGRLTGPEFEMAAVPATPCLNRESSIAGPGSRPERWLGGAGDPFAGHHLVAPKVGDEPRLQRPLAPYTEPLGGTGFGLLPIIGEEANRWGFVLAESLLIGSDKRGVLDALDAGPARPADEKTGIDRLATLGTDPGPGGGDLHRRR
jgi:hypothetical protein